MATVSAAPSSRTTGHGHRVLVLGILVAALVTAAIAAVVLTEPRPATYPPGSPEAAFQRYLQAFDAGDFEAAYSVFSKRVQSNMTLSEFTDRAASWAPDESRRVWIDRVDRASDRTTLHLTIERFYTSGLESSRYRTKAVVRLVAQNEEWKIDDPLVGIQPSFY